MSLAVRMVGIDKRFGKTIALDNVDLEVEAGSIHALVGENGAGKTTLMRILYGAHPMDAGSVELFGERVSFKTSSEAISAGVGMVSQHYGILPDLTCLQNLILGSEGGRVLKTVVARQRAQTLADCMGFQFDWHQEAVNLTPAGAQKLEILKLLWRNSKVMILDEPTAMLSPADSDALFDTMRRLASEGSTILLVTHRLPEVMNNCSQVTVLRGGRMVASLEVAKTSSRELAELIVGGDLPGSIPPRNRQLGQEALTVSNLTVGGQAGTEALTQVSFSVKSGEMVGIAGVDGSGQRELFRAVAGLLPVRSGALSMFGREVTEVRTRDRLKHGLRLIPEDRQGEAVVEGWTLESNSALGLQRQEALTRGGFINMAGRREWAQKVVERFHTKHGGLLQHMSSLSGGNQQRFVAARALSMQPKLIVAFQPARGLDLGATHDVYAAIRSACDEGAGALIISFDLDELLENCDRLVAMNGGRLYEPKQGEEHDRSAIGRLMVGAA